MNPEVSYEPVVRDITTTSVIHYGSTKYKPLFVKPISNQRHVKPLGGLWTSPVDSEWGWKEWCEGADFGECNKNNSFQLKFKPDTKALIIDGTEDVNKLPVVKHDGLEKLFTFFDYELLATQYDAIWLTVRGQKETRFSQPITLYGWDCETVFIMNPDCCYQIP